MSFSSPNFSAKRRWTCDKCKRTSASRSSISCSRAKCARAPRQSARCSESKATAIKCTITGKCGCAAAASTWAARLGGSADKEPSRKRRIIVRNACAVRIFSISGLAISRFSPPSAISASREMRKMRCVAPRWCSRKLLANKNKTKTIEIRKISSKRSRYSRASARRDSALATRCARTSRRAIEDASRADNLASISIRE